MHKADERAQDPPHWVVMARILEERTEGIYAYKLLCRRLGDGPADPLRMFTQTEMMSHPNARASHRPSVEFDRFAALRDDVELSLRLRNGARQVGTDIDLLTKGG